MEGTALVLNAHVRYAPTAIRALGRRGISVTAGSSRRFGAGLLSRNADRRIGYPDPACDPDGFLAAIEAEVATRDYDLLLPLNRRTVQVVTRNRSRLTPHTNVPFQPFERLDVALDKAKTIEAVRQFDIPHPRTQLPGEVDLDAVGSSLGYPVVVKPVRGSGRSGVRTCDSRRELERAYRDVSREHGPAMVQEFVPHGGERGVYTLYDPESTLAGVVVQRRLRTVPPEGGPSTYRETVEDPHLVDLADRLLAALDWYGVAMVEFRVDARTDEPKLLEINPRLWGSLALSVHAGVDFPTMLYQLATGVPPERTREYRVGVRARNLFTDAAQVAARPDTLRAVREYLTPAPTPCRYDIVSRRDPLPTLGHVLYGLECLYERWFGAAGRDAEPDESRRDPRIDPPIASRPVDPQAGPRSESLAEVGLTDPPTR